MPDDQYKWVRLNDFSPGIRQRLMLQGGTVAPSFQNGSATANTFRCIALPDGGLGPLPQRTVNYSIGAPEGPSAAIANGRFTICGLHNQGPVADGSVSGGGFDFSNLWIPIEWINLVTARRRFQLQRHFLQSSPPTVTNIEDVTDTDAGAIRRVCYMHSTRAAVPVTNPGIPGLVYSWFSGSGGTTKLWKQFPDPTSTATSQTLTPKSIDATVGYEPSSTFQNRAVACGQQTYFNGSATRQWTFNEQIRYTDGNSTSGGNIGGTATTFGQENPSGISFIASTNASEFFVNKNTDGAYAIRGDLVSPTVYRLPGVTSAKLAQQEPALTPIGVVYVSQNAGAWAWNGGDTATYLSPQLDTNFYGPITPQDFNGLQTAGSLRHHKEWIFFPNNWVYDYNRQSWWRLEDPSLVQVMWWTLGVVNDFLFGSPPTFIDGSTPVCYLWQMSVPAATYRWQSQPLSESINQVLDVREITVVAHGSGTVTVTLTGLGGVTSNPEVFTFSSSTFPVEQRQVIGLPSGAGAFQGTQIQVQLDVATSSDSNPAPIVYAVNLGYRERMHVRNQT